MSEFYVEELDAWGEPQTYRNLKIYPIKIVDRYFINEAQQLLMIAKNQSSERDIVRATYLRFLLYYMADPTDYSDRSVVARVQRLISYVTRGDVGIETSVVGENLVFFLNINGEKYGEADFEKIREIILLQMCTDVKYIDAYNPELEEKVKVLHKSVRFTTMAEDIFILSIAMQMKLAEIKELTYYQFNKYLERIKVKIDHDLYKPLLVSGQISFKGNKDIKSWTEHIPKKSRYSDIMLDADEYTQNSDVFKALN